MNQVPTTGEIRIAQLQEVFEAYGIVSMSDFLKGGIYVPNIPENLNVPTSTSNGIYLSSFRGATRAAAVVAWNNPVVEWVARITGGAVRVVSMNVLSDNTVIVGGHYSLSTVSFYNANGSLHRTINAEVNGGYFLARINPTGQFVWATHISGWTPTIGNLHSTATINNDLTVLSLGTTTLTRNPMLAFSPSGETLQSNTSGATRPYVVMYDSNGSCTMFNQVCGAASRAFVATALTDNNFVYGVSAFTNTASFSVSYPNGDSISTNSFGINNGNATGGNTCFLVCASTTTGLTTSTVGVWWLYINTTNTDQFAWRCTNGVASGFAVAMTSNAASTIVHSTGVASTNLPGPGNGYDAYVVMFNNSGLYLWHIQIKGITGRDDAYDAVIGTVSNKVFSCGNSFGSMSVVDSAGTAFSYTIESASGFIVCTSITGDIEWVIRNTGSPRSVVETPSGDLLITGFFTSSITFYQANSNTIAVSVTGPTSVQSAFIAEYTSAGVFKWATKATGNGTVNTTKVQRSSDNSVYVGGGFQGTQDLTLFNSDGSTGPTASNLSTETAFVARYISS